MFVDLLPVAGCVGCEKQRRAGKGPGHCGVDLLGLSKPAHYTRIEIPCARSDELALETGDRVDVLLPAPDAQWIAMACLVYAVPTAGLVLGAALGSLAGEASAAVLAALGLCAGLWFGRRSVHVPLSMVELCGPAKPGLRIVNIALEARS